MDAMTAKAKPVAVAPAPDPQEPAMVLTHGDLINLGKLMRRNVTNRDELLTAITILNRVSVEGVSVTLEPRLIQRLQSRCLDKSAWPQWLSDVVIKGLHDFAGW